MTNFETLKILIENSTLDTELSTDFSDGRLNSAKSEGFIINHIKNLFTKNLNNQVKMYSNPPDRYWYDMAFEFKGHFFPVNIKITDGTHADNISSKGGLLYALTGLCKETGTSCPNSWEKYCTMLTQNLDPNLDTDYYFIVYFKTDKCFLFTSLKRICTLTPNGSNLPFQCNWSRNFNYSNRTNEEQINYLIQSFIASMKKRVTGLDIMLNWEKECLNG